MTTRGLHVLTMLASGCLWLFAAGAARSQVANPRVTTDSSIDCSSAEAVVRQIVKPDMTDEQKAVACWRFMLDHYYHWGQPKEEEAPAEVRDFAKAINSYGFGICFVNAPVMTALWEACGFETRCWTITGHTIPEVKYGGAWHLLDADARGWHRKDDGQIASVEELANNPKLFTEPKEKSVPYYPYGAPDAVVKPFEHWGPACRMMDLYASKKDNYPFNRRAVMGHPMYLTLRRGEAITLSRTNEGKWFKYKGASEKDLIAGPEEVDKKVTYGNGHLVYQPDLKQVTATELLWLGSTNVKLADGKLVPVKDTEPAVAVFRVWCPYVLVEAKAKLAATGGAAAPKVEMSVDAGAVWTACDSLAATRDAGVSSNTLDLSQPVAGRYEYLLRVTAEKLSIASLSFDSTFQLAPLALPRLKPGKNKVKVFRGPDEGHVQLVLGNGHETKARYLADHKGLSEPVKTIQPASNGVPAYAVYRLLAPEPLIALSLGAHMTMDPGSPEQYIEALYSIDAGKTWISAWKRPNHGNWGNSQFEMDKRVELKNEAGAREALVKFEMVRGSKFFSVGGVRLYGFYRQTQPQNAKLAVKLAWQEKTGDKWADKSKLLEVAKFPTDFDLECGGEEVRLSRIGMASAP